MSRAVRVLQAVVAEALGLVVDGWVLPLGAGAILALAWLGVAHGGAAAAAFGGAAGIALWIAAVSVVDGRTRRRRAGGPARRP
ncbi:MAG TPA: hypothetical protein VFO60_02520 [Candidatus Dormibacteraeota bacterium]|nr:hypothetical protein [Candidatus Dormibacteraeota bacterium]